MLRLRTTVLSAAIIFGLLWQPGMALAACEDYASQAQAQEVLRGDPSDPEGLDPDGNGIACERFPPPYDREPVPRPGVMPVPVASPTPSQGAPEDDGDDEEPAPADETAAPEPTATPVPRSPLLGPVPPPLSALQGGSPIGPLAAVQGGNGGAYPPGLTVTGSIIQPPNTGDGGLLR